MNVAIVECDGDLIGHNLDVQRAGEIRSCWRWNRQRQATLALAGTFDEHERLPDFLPCEKLAEKRVLDQNNSPPALR